MVAVSAVVSLIGALDAELSCVREEAAAERARAESFSAVAAGHKMSADACMVRFIHFLVPGSELCEEELSAHAFVCPLVRTYHYADPVG